ncbi:F-box/kelch-repeat protein At3g06240-like [Papaver somniferum]|uniref:F-box/kelch-repeat protein At3g06240-like n=1 Tax=Papaver somniferum TaxID=3469 RepID=UPI000E6F9FC7|nr:F-box/kelch-repeat protein At3g06240-like [Papaver somniferum]
MGKFSDLPSDVMLDIFTRLPAESVVDCKSVSKTWNKVLYNPSFNQMHSILLSRNIRNLYFLEYDDEVSSHRVRKLKLNPGFDIYRVIGSCNGLVCVIGLPNHYTIDESSGVSYVAYICNPITGESITLPELDRSWYYELHPWMLSGFGCVASTNEYKVVRLYNFCKEPEFTHIEVYTLGSGKGWRHVGKINKKWGSFTAQEAVFADGFLYWNFIKGRIIAFDLANEIFVELDEYYNQGFC